MYTGLSRICVGIFRDKSSFGGDWEEPIDAFLPHLPSLNSYSSVHSVGDE